MKTIINFILITLLLSACHKSSTPAKHTSPNKLLATSFPGIDTMTMWNVVSGQRTGGKALFSMSGEVQIIGYVGSRGSYASGRYYATIPDTNMYVYTIPFSILNSAGDTISKGNVLEYIPSNMWYRRNYYYLRINEGKLSGYQIVSGEFVDSI